MLNRHAVEKKHCLFLSLYVQCLSLSLSASLALLVSLTHTHSLVSITLVDITLTYIYFLETLNQIFTLKLNDLCYKELHFVPKRKVSCHNVTGLCPHNMSYTHPHTQLTGWVLTRS